MSLLSLDIASWLRAGASLEDPGLQQILVVGSLVAARVAPLTVVAPWLLLRKSPALLRATLILALTLVMAPLAFGSADLEQVSRVGRSSVLLSSWIVREALVGFLFAFATALPFYALDWSGRLIDTWRGSSMSEMRSDLADGSTTPLGQLNLLMGITLFLMLGGHRLAIGAFAHGLILAPIGTGLDAGSLQTIALSAAQLSGSALALSLSIAAPSALSVIMTDLSLGLVARSAPSIPIFFAGMPLRAVAGIVGLLLGLAALVPWLSEIFAQALENAAGWVGF